MSDSENNNAGGLTRRSFLINTAATLVGLTFSAKVAGQQPASKTYGFINGNWFDGQKFESKPYYSVKGVLTAKKPSELIPLST